MKIWFKRILALAFLLALAPVARWAEWTLSTSFGAGDGEINRFYINYMVEALPTFTGITIVSLCLWWLRKPVFDNKALMASICSVLIVFGLLNFGAEIFLKARPKPAGDDTDHRAPYPYIEFKGSYESGKHNELGYGGKIPGPKLAGEYRIIFLGGSTVRFGEPAIPALVEQLFQAEGFEQVQVFNFGVSGSVTGMELARLVFEVIQHQPDMVVSYSGGNDIDLPLIADPRPGYPYNFMIKERNPLWEKDYPQAALFGYGSYLMRVLFARFFQEEFIQLRELQQTYGWKTQPWREQIAQAYVSNIGTSARIANGFDAAFVAFLQPTLLTKQNPTVEEQAILDEFSMQTESAMGVSAADWHLHDASIRTEIRARLAGEAPRDISFFDLSAEFDGNKDTTYIDPIHTEQTAKPLLARRIFETLRSIRVPN